MRKEMSIKHGDTEKGTETLRVLFITILRASVVSRYFKVRGKI